MTSKRKYNKKIEQIKKVNPFPAVCKRIYSEFHETIFNNIEKEDLISFDDTNKSIIDQDLSKVHPFVKELIHENGIKISVIGAGPAGLSCAYFLTIKGYKVTVFEKQESLGGMLKFGIPSFRLEKDLLNTEIDVLKTLGVEFKTGVEVGKDVSLDYLRIQGFEAFYIAIGAQSGRKLGLLNENAKGITTGVEFLRNLTIDTNIEIKGETIVIGGGNVAIDIARSAMRRGSSKVYIYCLENRLEMPSFQYNIKEAIKENISINNSWGPKRILVKNKHVTGIEFKKCISVFDENKRFNPIFDEKETKIVETNNVLISVGQAIDWGKLTAGSKIKLNHNMTIKADPTTYQTDEADVFAGGDVFAGPKFVIDAIEMGKEAAISIHQYLNNKLVTPTDRSYNNHFSQENDIFFTQGYDRLP